MLATTLSHSSTFHRMSSQLPISVLDSRASVSPVPVHYLPCSYAVARDDQGVKEANVSGYFTPSVRESDAVLPSGEKGDGISYLCVCDNSIYSVFL